MMKLTFVLVRLFRGLVDDGAVLQASQIEHSYTSISAAADKDVDAARAKSNIEDLLVMCNQLRFGSKRGNVPDCTSRVDA